jgi:hypothetical protein
MPKGITLGENVEGLPDLPITLDSEEFGWLNPSFIHWDSKNTMNQLEGIIFSKIFFLTPWFA